MKVQHPLGEDLRTLKRVITLFVTAAFSVMVAPVAAHAADPAYHLTTQYLIANPTASNATTCTSISIYLGYGNYRVDAYYEFSGTVRTFNFVPTVTLEAAWYTWEDCLMPADGNYVHLVELTSSLHPNAPMSSTLWTIFNRDGNWKWGSRLTPDF